jgi:MerR family transcriptional regulator, redox-sensitive transcriptional activator SoxR
MNREKGWRVGDIAKRAGIAVSAVHFYEAQGFITSWRDSGNQRRFDPSALRRIAVIKSAQKLGVSLKDISDALSVLPKNAAPSTSDWALMSARWHEQLEYKISQLQLLKDELDQCIGCGCLSIKACKLRNPKDVASEQGTGAVYWNIDSDD